VCVLAVSALAACSHQPPEYAWSHSASGEYLFAFDLRECGEHARSAGAPETSARGSPQFFGCMTDRGYYLVDPATGEAFADNQSTWPSNAQNAPQARR